ncbi:MAG: adenosylhomocysteinase [Candidatus Diapherotrites archaeon CG09_land_8_20_14_0_10_32_12]|nr:MAG: adenosylhomocysteinase [Candidatus Diapherotrites archaeon CG09_land_8_20_14_0_10_32_12]
MHETKNYCVKDINLAKQGEMNIEYAEKQMKALMKVREMFSKEKPLKETRIGMALHITKETAALVRTFKAGGADIAICSCNPLSTQDDVAAALAKQGFRVYGYKGETTNDYYKFIKKVIEFKPNITIDDGCDLVSEIHKNHKELIKDIIGGCEETTTGVIRLRAMEKDNALKYPIIAVNDNKTKHLIDNYYGTGQSTIDGILRASNILIAGNTVVVAGYGDCGKGFALRAKGLGAKVIVTEVDPFMAMQAVFDGHAVMPMKEAAPLGDLFVTLTGDINIITLEHMKLMRDGTIVANSGHFDVEIDLKSLKKAAESRRIRPFLDEYMLNGKRIYVAGEGRLVNLAAAEGHPSTVMSLSFCGQSLAVEYLIKNKGKLPIKVITLPKEIDEKISWLQLEAMNIKIDKLTEEQKKYLESWEEGT